MKRRSDGEEENVEKWWKIDSSGGRENVLKGMW